MIGKIFDEEMLIQKLATILLQIFCNFVFNSQLKVKSIIDPDDNFKSNFKNKY